MTKDLKSKQRRSKEVVVPNMKDYEELNRTFDWNRIAGELNGLPGGGLNIAHEAVDRHALGSRSNHTAIRWVSETGEIKDYTYAGLKEQTDRFANVLQGLEIGKGDVVCTLTGRIPELYITALGTLKNGSIYCPLFSIYGPEPIYQRMSKAKAKVLVTTEQLFTEKVEGLLDRLEHLVYILLTDIRGDRDHFIRPFAYLMERAENTFSIRETDPEDTALLHFTSGTTGMPKGVIHVHKAALTHFATGKYVLDFHPEDIFWCTADPGWVTGTSYGILAPLMHGITNLVVESEFDAQKWYKILAEERVTVWYTAPTAIRRLMRLQADVKNEYQLESLRLIHSVGEPLNPEAVRWSQRAIGIPIHDNWWQTETGGIMIANFPSLPIKPGSMGKPLPGIKAAIVEVKEDDSGNGKSKKACVIEEPGISGELALRKGWPSMFREYLDERDRYEKCFAGDWYLTGDLASKDEDGYFWFIGRADDIIKTAGHMVGPFEVESALLEHPSVAEAAVIGKPDPMMGELVKAFVVLKHADKACEDLMLDIKGFARKKLGPAVAPKEIDFLEELPKTRSGKILRRQLRQDELRGQATEKK